MHVARLLAVASLLAVVAACAATPKAPSRSSGAGLPPPDSLAKAALDASPRHGEFIDVPMPAGVPLRTWVSYPERQDKAGVVIVIHEIYGLSDWIRSVADRLAADGFVAVAPDLISGLGPGGGGTESAPTRDDVVRLVRGLTPQDARGRLDVVRAWATALPAANGKVGTVGFCWGGARSFEYAAGATPPQAAVVYYGSSPDSATLLQVQAPVLGHYGGDDARVNATIEPARAALATLGRSYQVHIYTGAGHGFLRQQGGREGANQRATEEAWPSTIAFLTEHLK